MRSRPWLGRIRSLLRVFVVTVPVYAAGIAVLEYLLAPRGVSLGMGVVLVWTAAAIVWIGTAFVDGQGFRFGLRWMLVATTVAAILCFLAVHYVRPYLGQRKAMELLQTAGVGFESRVAGPAWLQRIVGAKNCTVVTAVRGFQQSSLNDNLLECLSASPHVYELFIGNSLITDAGLRHIEGMTNLAVLDLPSGPQVSNGCLAHLPAMRQLLWIDASDVPVMDEGLAYLSKLTQIEQIELNRSQITDAGLVHLRALTNLRRLVLDKNPITDAGMKQLQPLKNLQMLSLQKTQVSDAGLAYLKDCDDLQFIRLSGTKVSDAGLSHLAGLRKLSVLEVDETQVTTDGLRSLQGSLPDCTIIHSQWPQSAQQQQAWHSIQYNGYHMYRDRMNKNLENPFEF
jgi:hypothetical protein